jgi:hypothetical protein
MNPVHRIRPVHRIAFTLAALSLATVCTSASAQWIWKDEAGHTIASDQPPPPSTPASRIIKQPRARVPSGTPAAPTPEAKDAPKSIADRDLESKQKAKEAAEAQKKADDDAARARTMKDNCAQVKGNVAALQAGGRAARFNDKGEKVYIDDAQRASEIRQQQGQIAQYCNQ